MSTCPICGLEKTRFVWVFDRKMCDECHLKDISGTPRTSVNDYP